MKLTKLILILSILLANSLANAKQLVVAVIDTGIAESAANANFLCKTGHKDFTGTGLADSHGHGTHISYLIDQYAKNLVFEENPKAFSQLPKTKANYCQIILKYFDPNEEKPSSQESQYLAALEFAIQSKVDIINFSGGGDGSLPKEKLLIKRALDLGIKVVVAAGNNNADLDKRPFYPAALDNRLYVVGNIMKDGARSPKSNYGIKVNTWEYGHNRLSYGSNGKTLVLTGTSQATAVKTGKIVREMLSNK